MFAKSQSLCRALGVAVALIVLAGSARAEKLLRLKFQPGETRQLQILQEMSQTMRPASDDPAEAITTFLTLDITEKCESVDKQGLAALTQTVERIRIKTQSAQGVLMEFDSATGKQPEGMAKTLTPMLDTMLKKPLTAQLTARGEVRDMKLPQGMLEGMNQRDGGGQLGNLFSPDWMKQLTEIAVLPEGPVKPGDTWTRKTVVNNPVGLQSTYRYEGSETRGGKTLERITSTSAVQVEGDKKQVKIGIKEQEVRGTIYFDNDLGRIVESVNATKMKMDMEVFRQKMVLEIEVKTTFQPKP
jgi:hypothetical protein